VKEKRAGQHVVRVVNGMKGKQRGEKNGRKMHLTLKSGSASANCHHLLRYDPC